MKIYAYWWTKLSTPYLMVSTDEIKHSEYVFAGEFEIDESQIKPLTNDAQVTALKAKQTAIRAEMTAKITAIDDRIQNLLALPGAA